VTLALPRGLNLAAEAVLGSAMSLPLPQTPAGALGAKALERIRRVADQFDVFAIGPGLRTAPQTQQMVRGLVKKLPAPVVVDADGLNALAGHLDALRGRSGPTIVTPHPGEMRRLAGFDGTARVQEDRVGVATGFARENGVILVLKGHGTVVTDGERFYVNCTGNPGMAAGGMGDVLTGLIAGLLCQGLAAFDAARLGVFVHGLAGDLAALRVGELSLVAEDVLERVPDVFVAVQEAGRGVSAPMIGAEEARAFVMRRAGGGA
jgi:NAD(P)H-hydrate epimerase